MILVDTNVIIDFWDKPTEEVTGEGRFQSVEEDKS